MAGKRKFVAAVAYLRTSSASNVGAEKDSEDRQRRAVARFAKSARYELVAEFYDPAVSGADPLETRPGFSALLDRIEGDGVRVVIVEDASRLARELVVAEVGLIALAQRGVTVLTASGDDLTATDDAFKVAVRQIAGVFSQLEKGRLVAKLKAARDRRSEAIGRRVEGRRSYAEARPEVVKLAKSLYRPHPRTRERRSYRQIAAILEADGYVNAAGKRYSASAIQRMLGQKVQRSGTPGSASRRWRTIS